MLTLGVTTADVVRFGKRLAAVIDLLAEGQLGPYPLCPNDWLSQTRLPRVAKIEVKPFHADGDGAFPA